MLSHQPHIPGIDNVFSSVQGWLVCDRTHQTLKWACSPNAVTQLEYEVMVDLCGWAV